MTAQNSVLKVHQEHPHHVTLELNRPEVRHALNKELICALTDTICQLPHTVQTVLIKSQGPIFCSGADLAWMKRSKTLSAEENGQDAQCLDKLFAAFAAAPQVVVVQAQGPAMGGGAGLVAAADIAVAGSSSSYAFGEVLLGLVAAVISPYVVMRLGIAKARALLLSGQRLSAPEALAHGLVDHVAEDGALAQKTQQILAELWRGGARAKAQTKALLRDFESLSLLERRQRALVLLASVRASDEAQEGMAAFLEKRAPTWRPT